MLLDDLLARRPHQLSAETERARYNAAARPMVAPEVPTFAMRKAAIAALHAFVEHGVGGAPGGGHAFGAAPFGSLQFGRRGLGRGRAVRVGHDP